MSPVVAVTLDGSEFAESAPAPALSLAGTGRLDADDVGLIVMGTHGRALAGRDLGSVARYVAAHAPCPVLVVPPSDGR